MDLGKQNWNEVYDTDDPNKAYEAFLSTLIVLYGKNCPLRKLTRKNKCVDKPWITKGIENACKKKNVLYRRFLKHRTKEAENKYKIYKNKLISIMRSNKKEHYHKLLEQYRSNTQGTWRVLNSIIKKSTGKPDNPNYFVKDNNTIVKTKEIANEFNDYFINVGYNLAKEIVEPRNKDGVDEDIVYKNSYSIFIRGVDEKEILDLVKKFKNKKSTDCTEIDMSVTSKTYYRMYSETINTYVQ